MCVRLLASFGIIIAAGIAAATEPVTKSIPRRPRWSLSRSRIPSKS